MGNDELILETLMDIKGKQGEHTKAIEALEVAMKGHKDECPAVTGKLPERVQTLEGSRNRVMKFLSNSWQFLLFVLYVVYDRLNKG